MTENIKAIRRMFLVPKDWRERGNLEFDTLFSICFSFREIAEKEIKARRKFWYCEYKRVRTGMHVSLSLIAILFICIILTHGLIIRCSMILLIAVITLCFVRMRRRKLMIKNNLTGCYNWLINEVLHPINYSVPKSLEVAFMWSTGKQNRKEFYEMKRFKRFLNAYGYTLTMIEN